eukprot:scaffold867_cov317-Pavlova_lutheri.AAC.13
MCQLWFLSTSAISLAWFRATHLHPLHLIDHVLFHGRFEPFPFGFVQFFRGCGSVHILGAPFQQRLPVRIASPGHLARETRLCRSEFRAAPPLRHAFELTIRLTSSPSVEATGKGGHSPTLPSQVPPFPSSGCDWRWGVTALGGVRLAVGCDCSWGCGKGTCSGEKEDGGGQEHVDGGRSEARGVSIRSLAGDLSTDRELGDGVLQPLPLLRPHVHQRRAACPRDADGRWRSVEGKDGNGVRRHGRQTTPSLRHRQKEENQPAQNQHRRHVLHPGRERVSSPDAPRRHQQQDGASKNANATGKRRRSAMQRGEERRTDDRKRPNTAGESPVQPARSFRLAAGGIGPGWKGRRR